MATKKKGGFLKLSSEDIVNNGEVGGEYSDDSGSEIELLDMSKGSNDCTIHHKGKSFTKSVYE